MDEVRAFEWIKNYELEVFLEKNETIKQDK